MITPIALAMMPKRNLLWALGISLAVAAVVSSALLEKVEDIRDTPMSAPQGGWHLYPSYLLETAGPLPPVYVIWLRPDNFATYIRYPEVKIYFSTYSGSGEATITAATIEVPGTECVYHTPVGARVGDLALVRFVQREGCSPLRGAPTGDLKLTVHLADRRRIGLGTFMPVTAKRDQGPDSIRVITPSGPTEGLQPVLRGYYVEHLAPTSTRRIDLLRHMWQFERTTRIWQIVGLACGLLFVSAGVILSLHAPGDGTLWRLAGRASLGFGCGAVALGLMYAVLIPPLQAPDEPDHLLSYGRLLDDRQLETSLKSWAQLLHFDRLTFHVDERFRPADAGRPFPVAWDDQLIFGMDVRDRSMTTTAWWNTLGRLVQHASVPRRLLLLRFANVLLFALSVAMAAALLMAIAHGAAPRPELPGFVFLLVPSLPFFAMHMSEFSVVTAAYVLFAACVLAMFIGGSRASWVGLPLGFVIALLLASGRSTLPMAPVIAALLCMRVLLGEPAASLKTTRQRSPAIFWAGLGVGLCSVALLVAPTYASPDPIHQVAADTVMPWLRTLWRPWVLLLMAAGGWMLELAAVQLRRAVPSSGRHAFGEAARWASFSLAAAILVSLVWSLIAAFPRLETIETGHFLSEADYVVNVLRVAGSWARAAEPDHLLSTSFWAGFGWLETIPGDALINMLTAGAALLLALLLVETGSRRDTRRFVALVLLAIGMTAAVAAYASATYAMPRNLHGRYLIGVYLTGLGIAFSPLALSRFDILTTLRRESAPVMFAIVAAIHAYCLSFVLHRYF